MEPAFSQGAQNFAFFKNNGGLNTTASVLALEDNEASDIQNVDLDLYGTIKKRNGYLNLNAAAVNSGAVGNGIYYYETVAETDYLMAVFGNKLYKMDSLDGTFDNITGSITLNTGANKQIQWKTYRDTVIGTNNQDAPFKWCALGGIVTTVSVGSTGSGGTNYAVGEKIYLTGAGSGTAFVVVATIGSSGEVLTVTLGGGGDSYTVANNITTTAYESAGLGSGCCIDVDAITTNAVTLGVPTGLTRAKTIDTFAGATLLGNVTVSSVNYKSRVYWSYPGTIERWSNADWVDVDRDDGTEITCIRSLGDRCVIFKERSIHVAVYTGDTDIPFTLAKTPSNVGCIARDSVQEVNNGLVFLSYDGLYYFDGSNSVKISDKLNYTFKNSIQKSMMKYSYSTMYRSKNQYLISLAEEGQTTNQCLYIWDFYTKAFTRYKGINASSLATIYTGSEERVYFADYSGFAYRLDTGVDDYPLGVRTAIDAYYKTKWLSFGDLIFKKAVPKMVTYQDYTSSSTLYISYGYDFEDIDSYTDSASLTTTSDVYGSAALYGIATYAGYGGFARRWDLLGRGYVIRIKFYNAVLGETFKISGFGLMAFADTAV